MGVMRLSGKFQNKGKARNIREDLDYLYTYQYAKVYKFMRLLFTYNGSLETPKS